MQINTSMRGALNRIEGLFRPGKHFSSFRSSSLKSENKMCESEYWSTVGAVCIIDVRTKIKWAKSNFSLKHENFSARKQTFSLFCVFTVCEVACIRLWRKSGCLYREWLRTHPSKSSNRMVAKEIKP